VKGLEWAGHLIRASEKKIFNTKPEGTRKVGRPKLRWKECVCHDIRIVGVKNWRGVALNREERIILTKAKAHKGLSCQWRCVMMLQEPLKLFKSEIGRSPEEPLIAFAVFTVMLM
jgi:hypothetical protein